MGTQDSTIRLWDYLNSRCVKTYAGHINRTYCLFSCFTKAGRKCVVGGSEDHKIYLWDLQTREIVQVLEGHTDVVLAIAVSITFLIGEIVNSWLTDTSDAPNHSQRCIRKGSVHTIMVSGD